ncbi:MAG: helicase-exonuclease AddAB subunit AddA [Filifactoraceae bacterium]
MSYTVEQIMAIEEENKNLLVAAAAGSGKTQVMVERIMRLILDEKISVKNMLIVTFTNASAAEMKDRIHKRMEKVLDEDPNNEYVKKQLELLPQAAIGTMHSFCIDVIRNNFNIVSIDPGFKIGLESNISVLKSKLLDELFEEMYNNNDRDFLTLVDAFGGRSDENLKDLVLRTYNSIQAQPYPIKWLEDKVSMYSLNYDNLVESEFIDIFLRQLEEEVDGALSINSIAIEYANCQGGPYQYIPSLESDRNIGLLYKELIKKRNLDDICVYGGKFEFERAKAIKKSDYENGVSENLVNKTKLLRDIYKKRIKDTVKLIPTLGFEKEIEKLSIMYPILKQLLILISDFEKLFDGAKRKKGVLDFNDLEHLTLRIFENESVRMQYKENFQYIFFDEYQDSNLVQETIIESIKRDDNLFFVGDVKQAIYRFRLSEPMLFNQRAKLYEELNTNCRKIDLSKNFRSNKKILDFTNFIFSKIMTEELGQVDYSKEGVSLKEGMKFPSNDGKIEFNIIDLKKSKKKDVNLDIEDYDIEKDFEYKFIVEKIKGLIGKEIYDPKKESFRKVEYGDISVLFRSPKGAINKLSELLNKNDIPNIVDYSEVNSTSVEVLMLCDYLKVIDNRLQDEALLGALTSFFGNMTLEDLIDIRIMFPDEKFLYSAVDKYRAIVNDRISDSLNGFFNKIELYKKREGLYELSDFIWQIVSNEGYLIYLNSLKAGKQKRYNVLSLIDKAREYSEGESNKLFGFLLYIDKIFRDKQDRLENVISDNESSVKLMSIHKSKGLEFPIVILCNTKKKFNEQEYKEDIILHNRIGIGSKYIDIMNNTSSSTLLRNVIIAQKKQEAISEEVRILYVAFTRAINSLIIIGATDNLESSVKKAKSGRDVSILKKVNNYFDWILMSLWNHDSMREIRNIWEDELLEFEVEREDLDINVNIISSDDINLDRELRIGTEREFREKLNSLLESDICNIEELPILESAFKIVENNPIKLSVTEVAKSEGNNLFQKYNKKRLHKTPKSLQGISSLSAMEIGTLMHSVIEHLDLRYTHTYESIAKEIEVMISMEKLTKEEAKYIDIEGLLGIFNSDVGFLLKRAKAIHKEESFLLRYEDKIIDGIIDCYFITENDDIILLDYKTDKEINLDRYVRQLELYGQAIEIQYNKKINKKFIYWFAHRRFTEIKSI